jgi:DNA-directed RNA polymerase subunit omega
MARVTVEDCLENVENRFALVHLSASRVRQLLKGSRRLVECKNKDIVTALREIARGFVLPETKIVLEEDDADIKIDISDL